MDVTSLYPYISNSEGNSAAKGAYESYPEKFIATIIITTFLVLRISGINLIESIKSNLSPNLIKNIKNRK